MRLLVIADDFTGALDTGVQFSKAGVHACVSLDVGQPFEDPSEAIPVLIIDAETRHLPPETATKVLLNILSRTNAAHFDIIYKKTDSGLRGNIGAELAALLAGMGERRLCFVPAFPKTGRTTRGGVQYIDGIPVADTVFGKDPFEPVRHSFLPHIIHEQSDVRVGVISDKKVPIENVENGPEILVFDAETDDDLQSIARSVHGAGIRLLAGCAGFAGMLPDLFDIPRMSKKVYSLGHGLVVISGSVNPITVAQIHYARQHGFACFTLTDEQKFSPSYADSEACSRFVEEAARQYRSIGRLILEAMDSSLGEEVSPLIQTGQTDGGRLQVARNIGAIVAMLQQKVTDGVYVFIGGDTFVSAMQHMGLIRIVPLDEIAPGVVFSKVVSNAGTFYVITKSGGFGALDILPTISRFLEQYTVKETG